MYKGYLIDLDGTAYLGEKLIKETLDFVEKCKSMNKKILFLTNNASMTQRNIYDKLICMGYSLTEDEIYTSAMTMAKYLKNHEPSKKVYLIGDIGLKEALEKEDIAYEERLDYENKEDLKKNLDVVVVGYTNNLTYKDLAFASLVLQNPGAKLLVTNKDLVIPSHIGGLPGNGAIVRMLEQVNNIQAKEVGKPTKIIMEQALEKLNLNASEVCMVGDNYHTDILAGINNNIDTIFVKTGVNTEEEVLNFDKQPTYIVENLNHYELLKKL